MTTERDRTVSSGWTMLAILFAAYLATIAFLIWAISDTASRPRIGENAAGWPQAMQIVAAGLMLVFLSVMMVGFFTLPPNISAVLVLFGAYKGTVRDSGFHWANPFYRKIKVSLRARNLNGDKLKVNDQRGNPIEIAVVVVWRVHDTVRSVFDVDDYIQYVKIQSESAVRHLASSYPYDSHDDVQLSLRGSTDEVSQALQRELQERLSKAGVVVDEARLSHLAYASEIAGAMLRRQQAEAVVAARMKIVEGAVGMVQMALAHLEKDKIVELDGERRAAMVSNLLVVLCGDHNAQPVVNTGTLYPG